MSNLYYGKFDPTSSKSYKVSRTKVEFFLECKRCFYLDRRFAITRPPSFPFNLNSAVDNLLKNEFDIYRKSGTKHPLQEKYDIDAIPFSHKDMNKWRENFTGISHLHKETGLYFFGAVDDVWINSSEELIIVDYKATSKNEAVTQLNQDWQSVYKRQMDFYQWLFTKNGFKVSQTGYFVYCNGKRNEERFNSKLDFDIHVITYKRSTSWIEDTLLALHNCLMSDTIPSFSNNCKYCKYIRDMTEVN